MNGCIIKIPVVILLLTSDVEVFVVLSKIHWNSRVFAEMLLLRFKDSRTGISLLSICVMTSVANLSAEWFDVETQCTDGVLFLDCVVLEFMYYTITQYKYTNAYKHIKYIGLYCIHTYTNIFIYMYIIYTYMQTCNKLSP